MPRMCPRCGKEGGPFVGPLCADCYAQIYGIAELPAEVEMRYCRSCGAYRLQGEWVAGPGSIEETVKEYSLIAIGQRAKPSQHLEEVYVKDLRAEYAGHGAYLVVLKMVGRRGEVELEEERSVRVTPVAQLCPSCFRRKSKSGHAAVIQIRPLIGRFSEEKMREIERFLGSSEERLRGAIISIEELREGIDVTVEDQSIAKVLANKLKGKFGGFLGESFKLTGTRGGEKRGVLSISARIVNAEPGSLLAYGNRRVLFAGVSRNRVILLDAYSGEIFEEEADDVAKYKASEEALPGELMRLRFLGASEGELLFQDEEGRVLEFRKGEVKLVAGRLREGSSYAAYLLKGILYLMGEKA